LLQIVANKSQVRIIVILVDISAIIGESSIYEDMGYLMVTDVKPGSSQSFTLTVAVSIQRRKTNSLAKMAMQNIQ
jgi:hypothetical protein